MESTAGLLAEARAWDDATCASHFLYRMRYTYIGHLGMDAWFTNIMARERLDVLQRVIDDMATTRNKQQVNRGEWGGYVNIRLSDTELETYEQHVIKNRVTVQDSIAFLLESGKVSMNRSNGAFHATLTVEHQGKLRALSSFSDDWVDALMLLAYKVTLHPQWVTYDDKQAERRRG